MIGAPPEVYLMALNALMDQTGTHHFEVDLVKTMAESEKSRGLAIKFELSPDKLVVATGRCDCPACVAVAGERRQ